MITYRALGRHGRLGNQLFEFAATYAIGSTLNREVRFPASWKYRKYFSVPDELFLDEIPWHAQESYELVQGVDPRAACYLQDYNLFESRLPSIRWMLRPSAFATECIVHSAMLDLPRPILGIHVRRGDNVIDPGVPDKHLYHLCPDLNYYMTGAWQFPHARSVAVFSDDIEWCKEHIPAQYYGAGVPSLKEHEPGYWEQIPYDWPDLFLLSMCDYLVISGSTFGVWGALLSEQPGANIVRPHEVYGPKLDYIDSELLFDPKWKAIDAT